MSVKRQRKRKTSRRRGKSNPQKKNTRKKMKGGINLALGLGLAGGALVTAASAAAAAYYHNNYSKDKKNMNAHAGGEKNSKPIVENVHNENVDVEKVHDEKVHDENGHVENADVENADVENADVENADGEYVDGEHVDGEYVDGEHVDGEHVDGKKNVDDPFGENETQESMIDNLNEHQKLLRNEKRGIASYTEKSRPEYQTKTAKRKLQEKLDAFQQGVDETAKNNADNNKSHPLLNKLIQLLVDVLNNVEKRKIEVEHESFQSCSTRIAKRYCIDRRHSPPIAVSLEEREKRTSLVIYNEDPYFIACYCCEYYDKDTLTVDTADQHDEIEKNKKKRYTSIDTPWTNFQNDIIWKAYQGGLLKKVQLYPKELIDMTARAFGSPYQEKENLSLLQMMTMGRRLIVLQSTVNYSMDCWIDYKEKKVYFVDYTDFMFFLNNPMVYDDYSLDIRANIDESITYFMEIIYANLDLFHKVMKDRNTAIDERNAKFTEYIDKISEICNENNSNPFTKFTSPSTELTFHFDSELNVLHVLSTISTYKRKQWIKLLQIFHPAMLKRSNIKNEKADLIGKSISSTPAISENDIGDIDESTNKELMMNMIDG